MKFDGHYLYCKDIMICSKFEMIQLFTIPNGKDIMMCTKFEMIQPFTIPNGELMD